VAYEYDTEELTMDESSIGRVVMGFCCILGIEVWVRVDSAAARLNRQNVPSHWQGAFLGYRHD
jgi:hypothetical protein